MNGSVIISFALAVVGIRFVAAQVFVAPGVHSTYSYPYAASAYHFLHKREAQVPLAYAGYHHASAVATAAYAYPGAYHYLHKREAEPQFVSAYPHAPVVSTAAYTYPTGYHYLHKRSADANPQHYVAPVVATSAYTHYPATAYHYLHKRSADPQHYVAPVVATSAYTYPATAYHYLHKRSAEPQTYTATYKTHPVVAAYPHTVSSAYTYQSAFHYLHKRVPQVPVVSTAYTHAAYPYAGYSPYAHYY